MSENLSIAMLSKYGHAYIYAVFDVETKSVQLTHVGRPKVLVEARIEG